MAVLQNEEISGGENKGEGKDLVLLFVEEE